MILYKLHDYKYHIGGILLVIIGLIVYSVYNKRDPSGESLPDIQTLIELSDKTHGMSDSLVVSQSIPTQDILEFRKLIKIFTHEIKNSTKSLVQFNTDRSSTHNYLNMRNNLFSKDIVTTKLLVDSNSLDHSKSFNSSNFKVILGGDKYPNTYKNVIGFRLLKCNVPISPYHIYVGDNKIYENLVTTPIATINSGNYTGKTLANKLQDLLIGATVSFSKITLLFTITYSSTKTIDWSKSPVLARTLGFYTTTKTFNAGSDVSSDYVGDFNNTFVDLVIDEIPQIACKDNSKGKAIIDRIPLTQLQKEGHITTYQTNTSEYYTQNFFYPMKLSSLTIQLYLDHVEDIIYDSQNGETNFEFELTILKNTKLMETTPHVGSTNTVYSETDKFTH